MKRLAAPVCLPLCFWKTAPNLLYWKETPSEKIPPKRSWRYTARRDLGCMTCLTDMKRFLLSAAHHSWRRFHKWTAEREMFVDSRLEQLGRFQTAALYELTSVSLVKSGHVLETPGAALSRKFTHKKNNLCATDFYTGTFTDQERRHQIQPLHKQRDVSNSKHYLYNNLIVSCVC